MPIKKEREIDSQNTKSWKLSGKIYLRLFTVNFLLPGSR